MNIDIMDQIELNYDDVEDDDNEIQDKTNGADVKTSSSVNYTPDETEVQIPITKSGAFISYDLFHSKKIKYNTLEEVAIVKKVENYFTIKTANIMGGFVQSKCCTNDKKKRRIIVPRFGVFELLSNPQNKSSNAKFCLPYSVNSQIRDGIPVEYVWSAELNENQKVISTYIKNNNFSEERVVAGSAGLILQLDAGQGKSFLAAYFLSIVKERACIILHSTSLIEQWKKVLEQCYPGISIGEYYGKVKKQGDVMLVIVNSGISDVFKFPKTKTTVAVELTPIEFYSQFGIIIFDEAHIYCNNFAKRIFKVAQSKYMLGLSATPVDNPNKFDKIIQWNIGPVVYSSNIPGYVASNAEFKATVHRLNYYGPPSHTKLIKNNITDMVSISSTVSMICEDDARNNLIIECVKKCLESELFTFVFADRRDYLEKLRQMLFIATAVEGEVLVDDTDYIRLVGGTKAAALETAEITSRVLFVSYQFLGTGKSIPKMNAAVFATPRKSKSEQYAGRIFRLGSDQTIERQIYDIVDMRLVLKNQWYVRKKYYDGKGFTIVEETHGKDTKKKITTNEEPITPSTPVTNTTTSVTGISSMAQKIIDKLTSQ